MQNLNYWTYSLCKQSFPKIFQRQIKSKKEMQNKWAGFRKDRATWNQITKTDNENSKRKRKHITFTNYCMGQLLSLTTAWGYVCLPINVDLWWRLAKSLQYPWQDFCVHHTIITIKLICQPIPIHGCFKHSNSGSSNSNNHLGSIKETTSRIAFGETEWFRVKDIAVQLTQHKKDSTGTLTIWDLQAMPYFY